MPSFRAQLNITALRPGHAPEAVMESAVAALEKAHHVEGNQLDIVAGVPRITLRYTVAESGWDQEIATACASAALMRAAVERVALSERLVVLRRIRGRWSPVNR